MGIKETKIGEVLIVEGLVMPVAAAALGERTDPADYGQPLHVSCLRVSPRIQRHVVGHRALYSSSSCTCCKSKYHSVYTCILYRRNRKLMATIT